MSRFLGFGSSLRRAEPDRAPGDALPADADHPPATSGKTVLPRPIASMLSFWAQSTSLSLRVGTYIGGFVIDTTRSSTLTSLEISRGIIEGILTRAGREVSVRSGGEYGKAEAESLLERSLAVLHTSITSASFFTAASFHFTSTTLSSAAYMSQAVLSTLDSILGSTESSRAIAAIITLIRREFKNLDDGVDKVGVADLLVGTVGFAMLQRWGKKNTERCVHEGGGDEMVWDVVILDNGLRADVLGTHHMEPINTSFDDPLDEAKRSSFISPTGGDESFDAVQRPSSSADNAHSPTLSLPPGSHHGVSDEDIRRYIMRQLPEGCKASVRSELVTARTITVDVYDDDNAEIAPPPGTTMIEERFHNDQQDDYNGITNFQPLPKHTVVFRTAFNQTQSSDLRSPSRHRSSGVFELDNEPFDVVGQSPDTRQGINSRRSSQGKTTAANPSENRAKRHRHTRSSLELSRPDHDHTNATFSPPLNGHHRDNQDHNLTDSDTNTKGGFGKGPLSKISQKVKPTGSDKHDQGKRPSPRSSAYLPSENASQRAKPPRGSSGKPLPPGPPGKSSLESARRVPPSSKTRPSSPVANRGLPRSPLQVTQSKSVPPIARRPNARSSGEQFAMRERSQESFLAQADAYSYRSIDGRPGSPAMRTHVRSSSSLSLSRSEADVNVTANDSRRPSLAMHGRSKSYTPSMYSVATAGSDTSIILAHRNRKSAYDDTETIQSLNRDGLVPGIFPNQHLVQNIRRFCRFSSASYGSKALKMMGVPRTSKALPYPESDSQEHSDFSDHTGLPASTILLSSFVDPAGGSNAAGETDSGFPLVHYLFLDHETKAVVLTLRGTWGFEDVLTDMTCDYDDLEWQGKSWKVHKGMHASAKRLLMGEGARVMITLRAALEEFPDYGVVLCGHSLGGGVAAILATMISEPSSESSGPAFLTTSFKSSRKMLSSGNGETDDRIAHFLPPGRPIHVYAYGPPAAMSPFLRRATRGLITTVVNGQDVVPSLSLGILHDMRTVSLAFKSDVSDAQSHVRSRVWENLRNSIINKFYVHEAPMAMHAGEGLGEDAWSWKTLKGLRDEMVAPKLMPPGEVFVVETMRVLQRNAFTTELNNEGYPLLGRPATRVQLKFIRDVEGRFGELSFGSGMFSDHNPARYEASLAALARGILDD